jgi:5-methyltetrahydrofolate--homocysteine methyltransferase
MERYKNLIAMIQDGNFSECEKIVRDLVRRGDTIDGIIQEGIIKALDIVGQKFSEGECFIPEMLIAAKASQACIDVLRPNMVRANVAPKGKVVIGTVQGDLHDIGKNIVSMTLSAAGYEVLDLGVDVPIQKFIDALKAEKAKILALSCLITTTMASMESTVKAAKEAGLRSQVKIMIGGPPTTDEFARKIGADFRGKDSYEALNKVRVWTAD